VATLERIGPITSEQAGLISTAQAARIGVPARDLARLVPGSVLERPLRGVYRVRAAPAPSHPELLAAWVLLQRGRLPGERIDEPQPPAVVSHGSAAAIHGLGAFTPSRPTLIVPQRRNSGHTEPYRAFALPLDPADWRWTYLPEGIHIAITTPGRTLVDLSWADADPDHVRQAFRNALGDGQIELAEIEAALRRRWSRGGRGTPFWFRDELAHAAARA
jgi:predicted transcriptional regulator of viral defense system